MKIARDRLNAIHNALRDLVGEQGAFILFAVKPDGEGEDVQIRISGPDTRLTGLLKVGSCHTEKYLEKKTDEIMKPLPKEPD